MVDRAAVQADRDAADAATMLDLRARRSAGILSRSAHIAWVAKAPPPATSASASSGRR